MSSEPHAGAEGRGDEEQAAVEAVAEWAAEGRADDAGESEAGSADPRGQAVRGTEVSTDAAEEVLHGKGGGGDDEDEHGPEIAALLEHSAQVAAELAHGFADRCRCAAFARSEKERRRGQQDGQGHEQSGDVWGEAVDLPNGEGAAKAGHAEVGDVEPGTGRALVGRRDQIRHHAADGAAVKLGAEVAYEQRGDEQGGARAVTSAAGRAAHQQHRCAKAQRTQARQQDGPKATGHATVHERTEQEADVAGDEDEKDDLGLTLVADAVRGEQGGESHGDEAVENAGRGVEDTDEPHRKGAWRSGVGRHRCRDPRPRFYGANGVRMEGLCVEVTGRLPAPH